jgi:hypothetical protein
MQTRKVRKTKKIRKLKKIKKTKKAGGLFDKLKEWNAGCPTGQVRMFGDKCGVFRGPFGCCRKRLQFSDFKMGGKKTRKYM